MIKGYSICLPDGLLGYIKEISQEKQIELNDVMSVFKNALLYIAKEQYGIEKNIKIHIQDNEVFCWLYRKIIDIGPDTDYEVSRASLNKIYIKEIKDDICAELLPGIDLSRKNMISFKDYFCSNILHLEKERIFNLYKDRIGDIVTGIVKHIDQSKYGGIVFDIGCEAYLPINESIECDTFQIGERIKSIIIDVKITEENKYVIFLSRKRPELISMLMKSIIPEISDGIIEIKQVARLPGIRSKVAVYSESTDAVGACIGIKGAKIKLISAEVQYEQIDIVAWSNDLRTFIYNCFKNINLHKIIIDEQIYIIVNQENKSSVIGKNGQNIRLVSMLLDKDITVMSEDEYKESLQT